MATVTDQDRCRSWGVPLPSTPATRFLGSVTNQCSLRGLFSLQVTGSTLGADGTYQNIFASYAGGSQKCRQRTATYYGSQSSPSTVVVSHGTVGKLASLLRPEVCPGR